MMSYGEDFWSEHRLPVMAGVGAAVLFVLGVWLRFGSDPAPPPMPLVPAPPSVSNMGGLDYSPNIFRASLEHDALELGVPVLTPEQLSLPFIYDAVDPRAPLAIGGPPLETRTLTISARIAAIAPQFPRGAPAANHLIVRIENRTDRPLAYPVDTEVNGDPGACSRKNDLPHDAIALAPHEAIERTECTELPNLTVTVDRVETMELPRLSYFYVSRLFPLHIGLDARATRGHVAPAGDICSNVPEQAIRRGMEKGDVSWRDVLDFYARHTCERYIFPVGYRAFTKPSAYSLPVSPDQVARTRDRP